MVLIPSYEKLKRLLNQKADFNTKSDAIKFINEILLKSSVSYQEYAAKPTLSNTQKSVNKYLSNLESIMLTLRGKIERMSVRLFNKTDFKNDIDKINNLINQTLRSLEIRNNIDNPQSILVFVR